VLADALDDEPLEVFHYHKEILSTNFKLNHDRTIKFHQDFMRQGWWLSAVFNQKE
jgi:methanesulfonate monooxygenase large subunit